MLSQEVIFWLRATENNSNTKIKGQIILLSFQRGVKHYAYSEKKKKAFVFLLVAD